MHHLGRRFFPYVLASLVLLAVAWAASFGTLPPADFAWQNGEDVKTLDPARATGAPEGRILDAVFEGLLRNMPSGTPDEHGVTPTRPGPAMAESLPEVSEDGRVYTFRIREDARWTNGDPVTSHDFAWSWQRMLHPETASEYAYQLYYIVGAEAYNTSQVSLGDRVEIELPDRLDPLQPFPRGTIHRGIVTKIDAPDVKALPDDATPEERSKAEEQARRQAVYHVDVKPEKGGQVDWDAIGQPAAYSQEPYPSASGNVKKCLHVLVDFASLGGVHTLDDRTLQVTLKNRTPYFNSLAAFYPLYPVNRRCVESHGSPNWTKPENIVSNGPYRVQLRRIRDRIRLVKSESYWNGDQVKLETIDAVAIKSQTTALNMYLKGQLDWATDVPQPLIGELKKRSDFKTAPALITYFYRLNVARPPLDDVRVRQALNMALNKAEICEHVARAGQQPALSLVPPGIAGYESAEGSENDIQTAKRLLTEAGYPGGRGLPRIQILYNTSEGHKAIAEAIQQQWKNALGIDVELRNLEWGTYLDSVSKKDYAIARAGWIGDYPDPNTFLDMFVTDGTQNNTNWGNPEYDRLIAAAGAEGDPERRMQLLHEAERILMDELPIIPIYFYVSINMINPRVEGFSATLQDVHPLQLLSVQR